MKIKFFTLLLIVCLLCSITVSAETTYLVNQDNKLSKDFIPSELIYIENLPTTRNIQISAIINNDLQEMYSNMKKDNVDNIYITSGYRDYNYQQILYKNKIQEFIDNGYSIKEAQKEASKIVAIPGTSEHQTGLALDFTTDGSLESNFEKTNAGKWLKNNSYKYGFILRYPEGKTEITNIIYEPWHFRYVGKDLATTLYENDWCLEEYYAPTNNVQEKLTNIIDLIYRGE